MNRTSHEIEPEEVMAYLDGELEAARANEVAAHVAGCVECGAIESDLRSVSSQLANWAVAAPSASVEQTIENAARIGRNSYRAESEPRARMSLGTRFLTRRWKLVVACGALGAILLAAVTVIRPPFFYHAPQSIALFMKVPSPSPAAMASQEARKLASDSNGLVQAEPPVADKLEIDGAPPAGPMIARTAAMTLVVAKLDASRAELEKLLARHHAFASQMTLDKSNDASPSLDATLQVPSDELDALLGELRGLGRVTTETLGGEDVSDQHVDLAARLHNARETETRLLDILRTRTGKVSDVLEVEQQISQTRGEIEQMEAQLAGLDKRVAYASIKLQLAEEYKAPTGAGNGSVTLRLRNAIVGGYRDAADSLIALAVFLLSAGPTLLIWAFILFWPARAIWKRRGALRTAFGKN